MLKTLSFITSHPMTRDRPSVSAEYWGLSYCRRALFDRGWLKVNNFRNSDNSMRYAYMLIPGRGIVRKAQLTQSFLRRKLAEYQRIKAEIAALEQEISRDAAAQDAQGAADRTDQLQDR